MDYGKMLEHGITLGLGSDVAGGPELNPWEVMKAASYSHQIRAMYRPKTVVPTIPALFHLATVGSARVLGLENEIGQLKAGYRADLVLWQLDRLLPYTTERVLPTEHLLSLMIYRGSLARSLKVWIDGRLAGPEVNAS